MRLFLAAAAVCALLCLGGCARVRVMTAIQADGSAVRTVVLTGQDKKDNSISSPTLEDTFVIPSGAGWKSKEDKKNDERTLTLERTFAPGSVIAGDVALKGDAGKLKLVNEAKVTRLGPNRFEYRETLTWKGAKESPLGNLKPEDLALIKASLPKALATDANANALADKMATLSVPMLFGPGDPLLAIGLLHPDLAVRRMGQKLGTLLIQALHDQFGDQMTEAQRRDVARQLIQETMANTKISQPDPAAAASSGPSSKSNGLTPLMFVLKTPGRIVSSNGETDDLTGEVFWAMFEEAAVLKDVVLTAVVEVQ